MKRQRSEFIREEIRDTSLHKEGRKDEEMVASLRKKRSKKNSIREIIRYLRITVKEISSIHIRELPKMQISRRR